MAQQNLTGRYVAHKRTIVPDDIYHARCVEIRDTPILVNTNKGPKNKVRLTWEITVAGVPQRVEHLLTLDVKKGGTEAYSTNLYALIEKSGLLPQYAAEVAPKAVADVDGNEVVDDAAVIRFLITRFLGKRFRLLTKTVTPDAADAYSTVEKYFECLPASDPASEADKKVV